MKKTLLGVLLCGVIGLVGSGCNNSGPAPTAPAETTATAPGPPAATAPNGRPIPANAPASIQRQMQYMNRGGAGGGGGQMGRPPSSYGGR